MNKLYRKSRCSMNRLIHNACLPQSISCLCRTCHKWRRPPTCSSSLGWDYQHWELWFPNCCTVHQLNLLEYSSGVNTILWQPSVMLPYNSAPYQPDSTIFIHVPLIPFCWIFFFFLPAVSFILVCCLFHPRLLSFHPVNCLFSMTAVFLIPAWCWISVPLTPCLLSTQSILSSFCLFYPLAGHLIPTCCPSQPCPLSLKILSYCPHIVPWCLMSSHPCPMPGPFNSCLQSSVISTFLISLHIVPSTFLFYLFFLPAVHLIPPCSHLIPAWCLISHILLAISNWCFSYTFLTSSYPCLLGLVPVYCASFPCLLPLLFLPDASCPFYSCLLSLLSLTAVPLILPASSYPYLISLLSYSIFILPLSCWIFHLPAIPLALPAVPLIPVSYPSYPYLLSLLSLFTILLIPICCPSYPCLLSLLSLSAVPLIPVYYPSYPYLLSLLSLFTIPLIPICCPSYPCLLSLLSLSAVPLIPVYYPSYPYLLSLLSLFTIPLIPICCPSYPCSLSLLSLFAVPRIPVCCPSYLCQLFLSFLHYKAAEISPETRTILVKICQNWCTVCTLSTYFKQKRCLNTT